MGECLILKSGGGTDTSDATATKEVILSGYTAYVNDEKITGEMKNNGSVSETLNAGGSYTVNSGYYSGGTVSVNSLASQTDANAAAAQILNTYTGWVKGSLVTGNMANKGTTNATLAANGTYTIPAGWHKGDGKVSQSLTTQAAATITPGTANKVACAASRWTTGAVTISGASTLTAGNIKNGVKIFGVTGTWTGWVDKNIYIIQNGNLANSSNFSYQLLDSRYKKDVTSKGPYKQTGNAFWIYLASDNEYSQYCYYCSLKFLFKCNIAANVTTTINAYFQSAVVANSNSESKTPGFWMTGNSYINNGANSSGTLLGMGTLIGANIRTGGLVTSTFTTKVAVNQIYFNWLVDFTNNTYGWWYWVRLQNFWLTFA